MCETIATQQQLVILTSLYGWGSGCGSVGRAVASDIRGLRFKSSHWQTFYVYCQLFLKDENKEKEAGNGLF